MSQIITHQSKHMVSSDIAMVTAQVKKTITFDLLKSVSLYLDNYFFLVNQWKISRCTKKNIKRHCQNLLCIHVLFCMYIRIHVLVLFIINEVIWCTQKSRILFCCKT